jgi:uncharacterized protein GlcG (DUF336 family)/mannose-6-phosphate isomerase-like protein (cupin superfamily)
MRHPNFRALDRALACVIAFGSIVTPALAAAPEVEPHDTATHSSERSRTASARKALTLEGARLAIEAATRKARQLKTTGVIAVVDDGGNLMALERLDNTLPAEANSSIGKARTAALFKKPTRTFEEAVGTGHTSTIAPSDFTPLQGGIPLVSGGQIIGGIGVSGAASATLDEDLAIAGADVLAVSAEDRAAYARPAPPLAPTKTGVALFTHPQVTAAFAAGKPLIAADEYAVHAIRREGPGKAEIHALDTDIAFIEEGSATLVTGGSAVAPKTVAPNEIRGESIRGGQNYALSKGDVVVIPKGIPHWFKAVSAPFIYYVVKVR